MKYLIATVVLTLHTISRCECDMSSVTVRTATQELVDSVKHLNAFKRDVVELDQESVTELQGFLDAGKDIPVKVAQLYDLMMAFTISKEAGITLSGSRTKRGNVPGLIRPIGKVAKVAAEDGTETCAKHVGQFIMSQAGVIRTLAGMTGLQNVSVAVVHIAYTHNQVYSIVVFKIG